MKDSSSLTFNSNLNKNRCLTFRPENFKPGEVVCNVIFRQILQSFQFTYREEVAESEFESKLSWGTFNLLVARFFVDNVTLLCLIGDI
jgi:hypothetical protein